MEKHCPNPQCNQYYGETPLNFCTRCGTPLIAIEPTAAQSLSDEITVIKNKIVWNVPAGEIAYRIGEKEMDSMMQASGIVINEGMKALIYIDGRLVAEIQGGSYDFVDQTELEKLLNTRLGGFAHGLSNAWKIITQFWLGRPARDKFGQTRDIQSMSSLDQLIASMKRNSVYSVILIVEKEFSLVFECPVHTARFDGYVGLQMAVQINNTRMFAQHFLTTSNRRSVSCKQLKEQFNQTVANAVQSCDLSSGEVTDLCKSRLSTILQARINAMGIGLTVTRLDECSVRSEDLNRLMALDREISLSEEELERLHRINIIKNRLNDEAVQRKIEEARNELNIARILNEINRDKIATDEEMQAFVETIAYARKLRNATNQAEYEEAITKLKMAQILRAEDVDVLVYEVAQKKFKRTSEFELMQLQSSIDRQQMEQKARQEAETSELHHQIELEEMKDAYRDKRYEVGLHQDRAAFDNEQYKRQQAHQQDYIEKMDDISIITQLNSLDESKKQAEHDRQMERLRILREMDLDEQREQNAHKEKMLNTQATMSAEQLTASQITGLSSEAQQAFFNSQNNANAAYAQANAERQMREFMMQNMQESRDRDERMAMYAMNIASGRPQHDYKEDLHREQDRYDRQQEMFMRYTMGQAPQMAAGQQPVMPRQHQQGQADTPAFCPKCGKPVQPGSAFCCYCGNPLQ